MNIYLKFKMRRYTKNTQKAVIQVQCTALSNQEDTDCNVFVIEKLPLNYIGESDQRFSHVADPVDMQDYGTKKTEDSAYFRTGSIQLRVRCQQHAQQVIKGLKEGVSSLMKAINTLQSSQPVQFQQHFNQTQTDNALRYQILGDVINYLF